MKFTTYIWNTDFFAAYKKTIEGSKYQEQLEVIMLPAAFIMIMICGGIMMGTIPLDIARSSTALLIKVKRKFYPVMTHYEKCPCCGSEEIPVSKYEDWDEEKQDFIILEGRYCSNCKVFFHDTESHTILVFDVEMIKENTELKGYITDQEEITKSASDVTIGTIPVLSYAEISAQVQITPVAIKTLELV